MVFGVLTFAAPQKSSLWNVVCFANAVMRLIGRENSHNRKHTAALSAGRLLMLLQGSPAQDPSRPPAELLNRRFIFGPLNFPPDSTRLCGCFAFCCRLLLPSFLLPHQF